MWLWIKGAGALVVFLVYWAYCMVLLHTLYPIEIIIELILNGVGIETPGWWHTLRRYVYGPAYELFIKRR